MQHELLHIEDLGGTHEGHRVESSLDCEVEKATERDKLGNRVTTVKCRGRIISDTASQLKETVRRLIPLGGRIIVDLGDVSYLDSSGLGVLVSLKVSALNQGFCRLEFSNMTPRVLELLRITKLMQILRPCAIPPGSF
jgi:anti-anti-sigma factor